MKKPELCVFCAKDESVGPMNAEHFIPKALWNGARPDGTKTVPAHVSCNKAFSEDVDLFRDILAMDAAATGHPEVQKLLSGKLKRKIEKRAGSIKAKTKPVVLPNTTESGLYLGPAVFMQVEAGLLVRLLRNMARGLYYSEMNQLVPFSAKIAVIHLDNANVIQLGEFVRSLGKTESFGDDVFRYKREFEPDAMACVLEFYKTRRFLCHAVWDGDERNHAGSRIESA